MKIYRLAILITSFFCLSAIVSKSQTKWQEIRGFGGVNSYTFNTIYALAEDVSYQVLYASIGPEVYRWKGGNASWEKVGVDSPLHADGIIYSVATDQSHIVYAAGWFSNSTGRYYVAKAAWNPNRFENNVWSELGGANGLNASGPIYSVITDAAANVYAAGSFLSTTGYRYVAKWDGTAWSELGTGTNALKANNYINTLCTDAAGNIYAAGSFTNADGKQYVAKWNGTAWSQIGSPTFFGAIKSIATDNAGNVYAAGQFSNSGGKFYVAKWDGSAWTELGTGAAALNANDYIYSVTTDQNGYVYAAGDFTNSAGNKYVAQWINGSWTELGTAAPLAANGTINSIITDTKNRVFAAGNFTNHNNYKFVETYSTDSNGWAETAPSGVGTLDANSVTGIATSVSGDTIYAANTSDRNVAKWDGTSWTTMRAINAVYGVTSITTDRLGNIYAVNKDTYTSIVVKWDGTEWVDVGSSENFLNARDGITHLITDSLGNLYVIGYFVNAKNKYYVAKWDGTAWSEVGTGANALDAEQYLTGLTVDNKGNIYVCAYKYFNFHVAKWNGTTWSFLESDPSGNDIPLDEISSIVTDKAGNVYSTFDNFQGDYFRKWDGSKWTNFSGASSTLLTINKDDELFTIRNGIVQKWNGNAWVDIGNDTASKFTAHRLLYVDPKGNLLTLGSWNNSDPFAIARYAAPTYSIQLCPPVASALVTSSIAGSSYQWQVNTGSGFVNIADNITYAGTKTNKLHVNNIPSSWYGYQFQCVVDNLKSKTYTIKFGDSWTGTVSNAWENPANWSCGVIPDKYTDVLINTGTIILNANTEVGSIKLSNGVSLTIVAGVRLKVDH